MLEHRAAQNRLAGQAATAARRARPGAEIGGDVVEQFRVRVQPRRDRLQGVGGGMVNGRGVELVCAVRLVRICTSGVLAFPMFSVCYENRGYPKRRFNDTLQPPFLNIINMLRVFGQELASSGSGLGSLGEGQQPIAIHRLILPNQSRCSFARCILNFTSSTTVSAGDERGVGRKVGVESQNELE